MATTSLWHIEGRLKDLIDYVENPEKTKAKAPELQYLYNVFSYVQRPKGQIYSYSDRYPECKGRYRRIKARRGHKKAIVAVCRMLLTAIWNILSKLEPYSAAGYLEDKLTEHSVVITKFQGLELLRKRGYIFKDESAPAST